MELSDSEIMSLSEFIYKMGYINYDHHYPIILLSRRLSDEVDRILLKDRLENEDSNAK